MDRRTRTWVMVTDAALRGGEDQPSKPWSAGEVTLPYANIAPTQTPSGQKIAGRCRSMRTEHGMLVVRDHDSEYDEKCACMERYVKNPEARFKFKEITDAISAKPDLVAPEPAAEQPPVPVAAVTAEPGDPKDAGADEAAPRRRGRPPKAKSGE